MARPAKDINSDKSLFCQVDAHLDSNPKIVEAGRNGREVFLFALRMRARLRLFGFVPMKYLAPKYVSTVLMMSVEDAIDGLASAMRVSLLEEFDGDAMIVGFDKSWDSTAVRGVDRSAAYRARKTSPNVTERHNTGDLFSKTSRNPTEERREEEEETREEEIEIMPRAARTKKPKGALADGWVPSRSEANVAAEESARARGVDLRGEIAKLRDWATSNNAKKADWDATWRNWTRNAKPSGPQHRNQSGDLRAGDLLSRQLERIRETEEAERAAEGGGS